MIEKRKKTFNYYTIIAIILVIVVADIIGFFDFARSLVIRGTEEASGPTSYIREGLNKSIKIITAISDIEAENQELLSENKTNTVDLVRLKELENENQELKKALDVSGIEDVRKEQVKIYSNPLEGDQGIFLMDKGKGSDIKKNQIIIDSDSHYIGRVSRAESHHAEGIFASHSYYDIPISIAGKNIKGIARFTAKGWEFDMIPKDSELEEGDIVLLETEELYYAGSGSFQVIIGQVNKITTDDNNIFKKGMIDSLVKYNQITRAFVLLEKK